MGELIKVNFGQKEKVDRQVEEDSLTNDLVDIYVQLTDPDIDEYSKQILEAMAEDLESRLLANEIEVAKHMVNVIINSNMPPEAS
jgi:hypothetical protein